MSQVVTNAISHSSRPIFIRATNGGGGIATLILDGDDVSAYLRPRFKSKRSIDSAVSGDLIFGYLVDAGGSVIDEVIVAPVGRKSSMTGNEQVEVSCHGGVGAIAAVEEVLREAGFMAGRPTELLERAHLNGKLSLVALEARMRLAHAETARQADFLMKHNEFQHRWERLGFDMAMGMRQKNDAWRITLAAAAREALELAGPARRMLTQHRVAIIGPVNAGKSTLANAIARAERHIISGIPGTTLDCLETPVSLRGLSVLLTDTAGLREPADGVEREGQARGWAAAGVAQLRLVVLDGSRAPSDVDVNLLMRAKRLGPLLIVLNKSDLGINDSAAGLGFLAASESCAVSARDGSGIDDMCRQIEMSLLDGKVPIVEAPFTKRQENLLRELSEHLESGAAENLLPPLRKLVGTRPDPNELSIVLSEIE